MTAYVASLSALILHDDSSSGNADLAACIATTIEQISLAETNLASRRLSLTQTTAEIHEQYRKILELSIRILEQTIYGSVSRGTKAKADYLATVAEGMHKKLQIQQRQLVAQTQSADMQEILAARSEELVEEGMALKRKIREAEEKLLEYKNTKSMAGVAQEYADVLAQIEKVQADVDRVRR